MKNIFPQRAIRAILVAAFSLAIVSFASAQKTAHSTPVLNVFVDKRSEVVETQDSAIAKFWAVADGSLLAAVPIKTPEYAAKRLRLMKGMKNPKADGTIGPKKTFDHKYTWTDNDYTHWAGIDGVPVTSVTFPKGKDKGGAIDKHQNAGKILAHFTDGGQTKLYLIDEKDANDASGHWKGQLLATYPSGSGANPAFSESAAWIVDTYTGVVVNAKTGTWVNVPANVHSRLNSDPLTYSSDDATALYGRPDGMYCVDMASGKLVSSLAVPAAIRQKEGYLVYPCRDGKSFVYSGTWWESAHPTKHAWLVKEGKAIELVD